MRFLNLLFLILVSLPVLSQTGHIDGNPKLAYWKVGDRPEVIIALHGGPCVEHSYLRPEFDGLRKTARIIYYDQRGCGKSELAETYLWQDHIRDIKRVIQTHAPGKKVFLVGSSWGSILALLYAYHSPEDIKGLILSGLIDWEGIANDDEKFASFLKNNHWENSPRPLEMILKENRLNERITKEGRIFEELVSVEKEFTWFYGKMSQQTRVSLKTAPVFDSLRRIKVPTLIFNGSKPCSYWESVNKYAELLPNSIIVNINGACHDPWFSNPQLFRKESNKFIRKHKKRE